MLIITCAKFRAVMLETLDSMSTDSFLMAMTRFLSRNPRPKKIRSDNGGNFTKSNTEIKRMLGAIKEERVRKTFSQIEWDFIPPYSAHRGGFYERLIALVKDGMRAVTPQGGITMEQFRTFLSGVERTINNRPIGGNMGRDFLDFEPITPAHFLMGNKATDIAHMPEQEEFGPLRAWYHVQKILDDFWRRACREITPHMLPLNRWARPKKDMRPGDVVLVLDGEERASWPMGRITEVEKHPRDGLVRTVTIKLKNRTVRRAVQGVLLLVAAVT